MGSSRFEPIKFDDLRCKLANEILSLARSLDDVYESLPDKKESLTSRNHAWTRLEESVMWAMRALRDDQLADEGMNK